MAIKKQPASSLFTGIPKPVLHNLLHKMLVEQVEAGAYERRQTTDDGRRKESPWSIVHRRPKKSQPLYQHYKNYCLLNRLKSKALSLLNTQFAKKPKNPT